MEHDGSLSTRLTHLDGVAVLEVRGDIDLVTGSEFQAAIERAFEFGATVVVDMAAVEFVDSQGIRALCQATDLFNGDRRTIRIRRPSREVTRLLALIGLDKMFPIDT